MAWSVGIPNDLGEAGEELVGDLDAGAIESEEVVDPEVVGFAVGAFFHLVEGGVDEAGGAVDANVVGWLGPEDGDGSEDVGRPSREEDGLVEIPRS